MNFSYGNLIPGSLKIWFGMALAVAVDTLSFLGLSTLGFQSDSAHLLSFAAASTASLPLLLGGRPVAERPNWLTLVAVLALSVMLRGGILGSAGQFFGSGSIPAVLTAAMAGVVGNWVGIVTYPRNRGGVVEREDRWQVFLTQMVFYSILLRLVYLDLPELLFEEAYYWLYAQHLDLGYLDHPPLVAWLIAATTKVLGHSEFGVRFGAFCCWLVAAGYMFRLCRSLADRGSGQRGVLLLASLPFFVGNGFLMTPDAPLVACWTAVIFYLHRMLVDQDSSAWIGLGLWMGLGMLSKYTMVLVAPGALLFVLWNRDARAWLSKPQPWLAVLLAAVVFSPVLIWNALNDWASFWFQSGRRMVDETTFTFPNLLGSMLFWLTPTGVVALAPILSDRLRTITVRNRDTAGNSFGLLMMLALVPLAVFVVFSMTREYRFHWGGTLLLATVPLLALYMRAQSPQPVNRLLTVTQRAWPPTIVVAMILYGVALHYLAMGLPGAPLPKGPLMLGYTQLGCEVERLTRAYQREHGAQPMVIGMDRLTLASGIAYYRTNAGSCAGPGETVSAIESTTSSHLFGRRTSMFEYWTPISELRDRPLLLVTGKAEQFDLAQRAAGLTWLAPVGHIDISHNGHKVGRYFYRYAKTR